MAVDDTIFVDLEHPENHGDFLVIPFSDYVDKKGHLIDGFIIEVKHADIRQIADNKYKAILRASLNEVVIYSPSISYPFLELSDDLYKHQGRLQVLCERGKLGRKVAKNSIINDDERQVKSLLLRFPEGYELTTEYTSKDSSAYGDISLEITPIQSEYQMGGRKLQMTDVFVQWTVHKLEDVPRIAVRVIEPVMDDAATQLAARLSGMNF